MISYEDFSKLDMRIGTVLTAEEVPRSDKLIKLTMDFGTEQRTLMAGIKKWYAPEALVGRQIAILFNLEPRKVFGIDSQGMILAAEDSAGNVSVLGVDKKMENGAMVK
ncbi:MAG: methionine--tRNA ligase subunit beta [Candidatus Micrarchaeota archaeon]|nr:methionine--tRNA ligase subunit beta [Candidatus Micrarchaeota archaeon]